MEASTSHQQRVEKAFDLEGFYAFAKKTLSAPLSSSESDTESLSDEESSDEDFKDDQRQKRKQLLYNFSKVGQDRKWLQELLMSDTESESEISDEDEYIKDMLRNHVFEKKMRDRFHKNPNCAQYGYFSSSILSNIDVYHEHKKTILGLRKRKRKEKTPKPEKPMKQKMKKPKKDEDNLESIDWEEQLNDMTIDQDGYDSKSESPIPGSTPKPAGLRGRRKSSFLKTPEAMAMRRRKVWQMMAKKEIGKLQRARVNNHKEMVIGCKRVATFCMKMQRQKAMQSQKIMKETVWRAKRLTREMQTYWKRYDRVERETKRRMEKEAEEQRKLDVELIEAKRQQRKLNFLITQTELYAHFMSKKLGSGSEEEQLRILSQLDEETHPRLATIDDYNSDLMKVKAQKNASDAYLTEKERTRQFDSMAGQLNVKTDHQGRILELPTPAMFKGVLKGYQIKGMTWLANLYDQGISGILADEMGLGKTVQSIALLCHIAENFGVWGPFLIISPASTLHNWQQEMERFVPDFRVVPYWGSPNERKILRQFWEQKDLHTKDASFHVVITSYQLVVSDYKYFNRIKWQYMVLDEAQAIKSSSSVRWKLLLGFNCRNRLLLSGTPIQNSMAELWALLHFIMPTLFDSHDEFNEWFSKDIESHAENKTGIDEKQISRLHMILKPFMLRRIKKDVENELSDKIEIMVYCPLTTRQRLLYMALKKKIRIEDLLATLAYTRGSDGHNVDKTVTSNLLNLVMQFRKVCNHPELFERRDSKSPYAFPRAEFCLPRLIFHEAFLERRIPSQTHLLYNRFSIFKAENVQRSLFPRQTGDKRVKYVSYVDVSSTFSFTRFIDLSPAEIEGLTIGGLIYYFLHCQSARKKSKLESYRVQWWPSLDKRNLLLETSYSRPVNDPTSSIIPSLLFTRYSAADSRIYTFTDHTFQFIPESMEHRIMRSRNQGKIEEIKSPLRSPTKSPIKCPMSPIKTPTKAGGSGGVVSHASGKSAVSLSLVPEFPHFARAPKVLACQKTEMPTFVCGLLPRVGCRVRRLYCESREAAWMAIRTELADTPKGRELMGQAVDASRPTLGWSNISIPDKQTLVTDAGKLAVLDSLLTRLKAQNHRVLIYSQMTKMIDLLEEYMWHRKHRYMRLDGSSKISARRDMVADFQTRADIFVFLLSTRAGGLGINLTAADTVIFYDSDWNPTVDQQAMDRAHRLGQTKQVTVYRLICKGTIEERILQRAREKSEIQRMVISGGNFKPDTLKPKEVVSLLLDDEEIVSKCMDRQKTEERKPDEPKGDKEPKKRKSNLQTIKSSDTKRSKTDGILDADDLAFLQSSNVTSPAISEGQNNDGSNDSSNEALVVDMERSGSNTPVSYSPFDGLSKARRRHHPRGTRRGRPRGIKRGGLIAGALERPIDPNQPGTSQAPPPPPKRGPGRPRTKPPGPPNQGYRGAPRGPRKQKPLVVPLGQSPITTPVLQSPAVSRPDSPSNLDKTPLFGTE